MIDAFATFWEMGPLYASFMIRVLITITATCLESPHQNSLSTIPSSSSLRFAPTPELLDAVSHNDVLC